MKDRFDCDSKFDCTHTCDLIVTHEDNDKRSKTTVETNTTETIALGAMAATAATATVIAITWIKSLFDSK